MPRPIAGLVPVARRPGIGHPLPIGIRVLAGVGEACFGRVTTSTHLRESGVCGSSSTMARMPYSVTGLQIPTVYP